MWYTFLGIKLWKVFSQLTVLEEQENTITPFLRETLPSECFTLSIFALKVLAEFKGNCQQHQMPYCIPFPRGLRLGSYWEVGFPLSWEGTTATKITLTQRDRLDFLCVFLPCLTFIASSYHILDGEKPCLRAYWAHALFGRSKIINDS